MKLIMTLLLALNITVVAAESVEAPASTTVEQSVVDSPQAGTVRRANFTSNIIEHEPVDNLLSLSNTETTVYFFTELRGFSGQTVTHRWHYKDEVLADVAFDVGGQRWRVWSKKTLLPSWLGDIHVDVLDEQGQVVSTAVLSYTEASQ